MAKKFNYKLPSMVALTLFGTAFTAHQANAAEQPQDQSNHKNVLDDQTALKQAEKAKKRSYTINYKCIWYTNISRPYPSST